MRLLWKWKLQESDYGATTSRIRAWIGIVTGSLGMLIRVLFILSLLAGK